MNESILLEYYVPIDESAEIDGDFYINGIAINETTTSNGHTFIQEELKKAASTLIGVPLLKDHNNSIDAIVGRVKAAHFDENLRNIPFKAIIKDSKIKQMIKDNLINSVSVGAYVKPEDIEEAENETIIPHNIIFKELSLVAIPADSQATFTFALKQAFNKIKEDKNQSIERRLNSQEKMENETIIESPKVEVVEEVKPDLTAELKSKLESMEKLNKELTEKISKLESSDADEVVVKDEEVKPEVTPEVEKKEEVSEEVEEVEDEEDTEVQEDYKIVQGHNSFSIVRNKY